MSNVSVLMFLIILMVCISVGASVSNVLMQVEGDAEEAEDTLAGVTVGALRNWLRQVRWPGTPRPASIPAPRAPPVAAPDAPVAACALGCTQPEVHCCRRHMQGRELSYQILGLAARLAPEALPGSPEAWAAALAGGLPDLHHQHLRLMERHILIPMLQTTPPHARCAIAVTGAPACP
jgi:hypothetical protein